MQFYGVIKLFLYLRGNKSLIHHIYIYIHITETHLLFSINFDV